MAVARPLRASSSLHVPICSRTERVVGRLVRRCLVLWVFGVKVSEDVNINVEPSRLRAFSFSSSGEVRRCSVQAGSHLGRLSFLTKIWPSRESSQWIANAHMQVDRCARAHMFQARWRSAFMEHLTEACSNRLDASLNNMVRHV